jgi:hypothetical protein
MHAFWLEIVSRNGAAGRDQVGHQPHFRQPKKKSPADRKGPSKTAQLHSRSTYLCHRQLDVSQTARQSSPAFGPGQPPENDNSCFFSQSRNCDASLVFVEVYKSPWRRTAVHLARSGQRPWSLSGELARIGGPHRLVDLTHPTAITPSHGRARQLHCASILITVDQKVRGGTNAPSGGRSRILEIDHLLTRGPLSRCRAPPGLVKHGAGLEAHCG